MTHERYKSDCRDDPAYSIAEAAHHLNVPIATIRYWSLGREHYEPLIELPAHSENLLSFLNLVELHVLAAIRRKYRVSMPKVRTAIDYLKRNTRSQKDKRHPLLSKALETDGLDLFVEQFGALINISKDGQVAMRNVLKNALKRIERDERGLPVRLFPFTRSSIESAPSIIVIDPRLSAGRPVISGTGLATEIIAERYKAGESIEELARDYERPAEEIEEAVRCELQTAA
ncbi:MAG: DUF433 domain-containing protein [Pseudomonadales bacterium]